MAEIFLARSRGLAGFARYVVLKRILPERGTDPRWIEMFLDEARLVAQLQHPNIAQVFDLGRLGDGYFFTMEYVHGANMREVLVRCSQQGRRMAMAMAIGVAAGAAAGLDHAHNRRDDGGTSLGIVHRDVSPSNLMLSHDGVVKLVDFGVAKAQLRSSVTQSGTVKGKISYLSPEQCRGRAVDLRSDLFALGIVLYEMATTKRLYRRNSDFETMTAIVNEPTEPPSRYNPEISPDLEGIILRALSKDPARRQQSAGELLEALEDVAQRQGLQISNSHLRRQMRELYGEQLEPWRVLDGAPARREIEITYTADGLLEEDEEDIESVEIPLALGDSVPTAKAGEVPVDGNAMSTRQLSIGMAAAGGDHNASSSAATGRGLAPAFPVEIDAAQVPLLDSLRAAISTGESAAGAAAVVVNDEDLLETDPLPRMTAASLLGAQANRRNTDSSSAHAGTGHFYPPDPRSAAPAPSLASVTRPATEPPIAGGRNRGLHAVVGDPRSGTAVAPVSHANAPTMIAPPIASERGPVPVRAPAASAPTDKSARAPSASEASSRTAPAAAPQSLSEAITVPVANADSLSGRTRAPAPLPSKLAAGQMTVAANPPGIWDRPMPGVDSRPARDSREPAAQGPAGPRQPALGTPGYVPRATLLGSAPAPTYSRSRPDSKPFLPATQQPPETAVPSQVADNRSGSKRLPISTAPPSLGSEPGLMTQPSSPMRVPAPQPPHRPAMTSPVYPRAPSNPPRGAPNQPAAAPGPTSRLINATVAIVALVGIGLGVWMYFTFGGESASRPAIRRAVDASVETGRSAVQAPASIPAPAPGAAPPPLEAAVDATVATALPTDAANPDRSRANDDPSVVIDKTHCLKMDKHDEESVRKACVEFLCKSQQCASTRSTFASLPREVRDDLAKRYPALRPDPVSRPRVAPAAEVEPPCSGALCRR
jgi:eukaryotic-like serine/threonine-protein kinase